MPRSQLETTSVGQRKNLLKIAAVLGWDPEKPRKTRGSCTNQPIEGTVSVGRVLLFDRPTVVTRRYRPKISTSSQVQVYMYIVAAAK